MTRTPLDPRPLLESLRTAFDVALADDPARRTLAMRCLDELDRSAAAGPIGAAGLPGEPRPPACRHLERALANAEYREGGDLGDAPGGALAGVPDPGSPDGPSARASRAATADVARALADIAPSLHWYRRGGADAHGTAFHDGHANAFVVGGGADGLDGGDAMLGVTLVTPGVRYPDHRHAPEELYLVLSSGHWRHGESSWFEPGIGGVVHNVPHVVHAMRSGEAPLLAIWCLLPTDGPASGPTSRTSGRATDQAASR